jgi:hypothetical protein
MGNRFDTVGEFTVVAPLRCKLKTTGNIRIKDPQTVFCFERGPQDGSCNNQVQPTSSTMFFPNIHFNIILFSTAK